MATGAQLATNAQLDGSAVTQQQPAVLPQARSNGVSALPDAPAKPGLDAAPGGLPQPPAGLDARILAGEFGDDGSTKERLSRPLRKLLARDRIGIGAPAFVSLPVRDPADL